MNIRSKQALFRILRMLLGALFIFSGLVKCIDPTGGAIKVEDYFVAWGWLGAPWWLCMTLSVIQNVVEFTAGFMLVCGVYVSVASFITLAFMVFFTPLTLYIALANPVSDCGCFGDAFKVTNWQTFGKNIVFLVVAIFVFRWRNVDGRGGKKWRQAAMTAMGLLVAGLVTMKGMTDEPMIDFRPYAVGTDVKASMSIPEDAPMTEYKTTFILEKDGVRKEFDENNYPYEDSTWVFIDSKSEVVSEGYIPPIADFSFVTPEGEDMSDALLNNANPVFVAISPKLDKADKSQMVKLGHQFELAQKNGFDFFVATSSSSDEFIAADSLAGVALDYLQADETMLKTIVRSNPGLIVLQNGVIVAKYNLDHVPFDAEMASPAAAYLSNLSRSYAWMMLVCLGLSCIVVWLLLYYDRK
ncbi:MAG: BT_3928 family protein [Marinilabiliaceae bacterium]